MGNFLHNKGTSLNVYLKARKTFYSNTVERDTRKTQSDKGLHYSHLERPA